jgi:hypothetical protein
MPRVLTRPGGRKSVSGARRPQWAASASMPK